MQRWALALVVFGGTAVGTPSPLFRYNIQRTLRHFARSFQREGCRISLFDKVHSSVIGGAAVRDENSRLCDFTGLLNSSEHPKHSGPVLEGAEAFPVLICWRYLNVDQRPT
jgi:hypothetical protein